MESVANPRLTRDTPHLHFYQPRTAYRTTITPYGSVAPRLDRDPGAHHWGKNRFPPPTIAGQTIIWNSSTRPARIVCAASSGPSTVMSCSASALSRETASGSNSRSIFVRALRGSSSRRSSAPPVTAWQNRARSAVDREPCARPPRHHGLVHPPSAEIGAE